MRVEADIKLGFKDVLFKPKRSTLKSRSQVSLERTFRFVHTDTEWTGVPVIAANMDTVGNLQHRSGPGRAQNADCCAQALHR